MEVKEGIDVGPDEGASVEGVGVGERSDDIEVGILVGIDVGRYEGELEGFDGSEVGETERGCKVGSLVGFLVRNQIVADPVGLRDDANTSSSKKADATATLKNKTAMERRYMNMIFIF